MDFLKEIRVKAGYRQVDLAEQLGVTQSRISKYEVGERRVDILELRDICAALKLPFVGCVQELEDRLRQTSDESN